MSYYTQKQLFYIDSHKRTNGSDSKFSYILDVDPNVDFTDVVLLSASIPLSYYIVDNNNNTFTITENLGAGDLVRILTLPIGNYNRISFARVLTSVLNDNSNTYIYTISYENINREQDTGKYYFLWSNSNISAEEPIFAFSHNRMYEICGFNANSSNTFSSNALVSTNRTNFRPESTLNIHSNICQNRNNNILQNIISSGDSNYTYIVFHNLHPDEYSKEFVQTKSNTYDFELTDEDYNPIDLNGLNFTACLLLFKRNINITELIKGFIKLKTLEK
jgi:hypothetical protein